MSSGLGEQSIFFKKNQSFNENITRLSITTKPKTPID